MHIQNTVSYMLRKCARITMVFEDLVSSTRHFRGWKFDALCMPIESHR